MLLITEEKELRMKEGLSLSKHNYSQYSNKKKNGNAINSKPEVKMVVEPVETTPIREPINATPVCKSIETTPVREPINVKPVHETVDTVVLPETVNGVVVNCVKLNVRAEPSIDAEIVCVLDVMSEIKIDAAKSTNEWLSVCATSGVDGYCMRKFVDAHL